MDCVHPKEKLVDSECHSHLCFTTRYKYVIMHTDFVDIEYVEIDTKLMPVNNMSIYVCKWSGS
jgi:hypothetical protein